MRLRVTKKQAKIIILVIWLAALITSLPIAILSRLENDGLTQANAPSRPLLSGSHTPPQGTSLATLQVEPAVSQQWTESNINSKPTSDKAINAEPQTDSYGYYTGISQNNSMVNHSDNDPQFTIKSESIFDSVVMNDQSQTLTVLPSPYKDSTYHAEGQDKLSNLRSNSRALDGHHLHEKLSRESRNTKPSVEVKRLPNIEGSLKSVSVASLASQFTMPPSSPQIAQSSFSETERHYCHENWSFWPLGRYYYSSTLMILQFVVPLFVLVITYSRIVIIVWGKKMPGEEDDARDARMARSKRKVSWCVSELFVCLH